MANVPTTRNRQNWIWPNTLMQQWLDDFFSGSTGGHRTDTDWTPRADIYEEGNNYVMELDLPGLKREDVKITCTDDMIKISGTRQHQNETNEENFHRMERMRGAFSRQFTLPSDVNSDQINAEMKNGVLRVTIPKTQTKANEKMINIK